MTRCGPADAHEIARRNGALPRPRHLGWQGDNARHYGLADLEAKLLARYAPAHALRLFLVQQLAAAMWRLLRASRLEVEVPSTLEHRRAAGFGTGHNPPSPRSWDASRLGVLVRYLARHERRFRRLLRRLEADEPDEAAAGPTGDALLPNEPELPPRAEPPCEVEVAVLRQVVERLVAEADWRALERGLAGRSSSARYPGGGGGREYRCKRRLGSCVRKSAKDVNRGLVNEG